MMMRQQPPREKAGEAAKSEAHRPRIVWPVPSATPEAEALAARLRELGPDLARWPRDEPWSQAQREALEAELFLNEQFEANCAAITQAQCRAVQLPWLKTHWGGLQLSGYDEQEILTDPDDIESGESDGQYLRFAIDLYFDAVRAYDNRPGAPTRGCGACADVSLLIQELLDERCGDEGFEDGQYATGRISIDGDPAAIAVTWAHFCEHVRMGLFEDCEKVVADYLAGPEANRGPSASEESQALAGRLRELGPDTDRWPRDEPWMEVQRSVLEEAMSGVDGVATNRTAITDEQCAALELPWLKTRWGGLLLTVGRDDGKSVGGPITVDDDTELVLAWVDLYVDAGRDYAKRAETDVGCARAWSMLSERVQEELAGRVAVRRDCVPQAGNSNYEDATPVTKLVAIMATLDVDYSVSSGQYHALTDGLLIIRYLEGVTGGALTHAALGQTASRTDAAAIKAYLDGVRPLLDVDADNTVTAATDGVLILLYMLGLRGAALIANVAPTAVAADVEARIPILMP